MDRSQIVHSNPEILGGTPVFVGTRVPVQTLLVYLEKGETLEEFLDNYPTVSREQAVEIVDTTLPNLRRLLPDIQMAVENVTSGTVLIVKT